MKLILELSAEEAVKAIENRTLVALANSLKAKQEESSNEQDKN
jgi:hypothetical protein|nr:MAG TPA: hypothetical protein [Caudoviricetes sp.]